jgi:hypothetical protein
MTTGVARRADAIRAASAVLGGFALLAAFDAWAIAAMVPTPGLAARIAHHVYDAAETLGVGALLAIVVGAFVRFVHLPRPALGGVAFVAAISIVHRVMGAYLTLFSERVRDGRFVTAIYLGWTVGLGIAIAGAPFLGARLARRPILRWLPVPLALAALALDQVAWRDDYMDAHGILALVALLFGGAALAPHLERAGRALARGSAGRLAIGALGLFALFGLVHPPPNATRFELFRQPCALAPWILATLEWRAPDLHAPVRLSESPWLVDRARAPAVQPTAPAVLPSDAVAVLVTLDAVRADVVADPRNDARFPTLARMKREGVVFTHAYAPGAQTEVSLATMFSGRYFSELSWKSSGSGRTFHAHPAEDPSPRFPELLSDHGVATSNYVGIAFLGAEFGVARGFREETLMLHPRSAESGYNLIAALSDRLEHPGPGPLFLCTHLTESHSPYVAGKPGDSDYARYLDSIAYLDNQLGHVLRVLETRCGQRWALFVSADHGESFGQHETREHGKTLYEELLRVPLLAMSPHFPASTVDAPVGLVDLAPTLLDLFGADTPATFDGQSLAPFLAGGTALLTRPLFAEGRLRRALMEPDGLKVIDDPRRKVVEAYDLARDPGEMRNVFDLEPGRSGVALAELRSFFAVHAWREPGYEEPYKP